MIREAEVRRYVRQHLIGPTPVGLLTLPGDVPSDEVEYVIDALQTAAASESPWPPVVVGYGMDFVATHQPSRRYAGRRLLLAIQGGPDATRRGETR